MNAGECAYGSHITSSRQRAATQRVFVRQRASERGAAARAAHRRGPRAAPATRCSSAADEAATKGPIELLRGAMPLVGFERLAAALPPRLRGALSLHSFALLDAGPREVRRALCCARLLACVLVPVPVLERVRACASVRVVVRARVRVPVALHVHAPLGLRVCSHTTSATGLRNPCCPQGVWLYDFLPAAPTAPSTVAMLLVGGAVPGVARARRLAGRAPRQLPPGATLR